MEVCDFCGRKVESGYECAVCGAFVCLRCAGRSRICPECGSDLLIGCALCGDTPTEYECDNCGAFFCISCVQGLELCPICGWGYLR